MKVKFTRLVFFLVIVSRCLCSISFCFISAVDKPRNYTWLKYANSGAGASTLIVENVTSGRKKTSHSKSAKSIDRDSTVQPRFMYMHAGNRSDHRPNGYDICRRTRFRVQNSDSGVIAFRTAQYIPTTILTNIICYISIVWQQILLVKNV